jgi:streptogramin lyase
LGAAGVVRRLIAVGTAGSVPFAIAPGRDGDMWFTDAGRRPAIGRITPSGQITEFSQGLARGSVPFETAVGATVICVPARCASGTSTPRTVR